MRFGQDYGGTKFNEGFPARHGDQGFRQNALSGLSGTGMAATGSTAALSQSLCKTIAADLAGSGGFARAAGIVGGANALAGRSRTRATPATDVDVGPDHGARKWFQAQCRTGRWEQLELRLMPGQSEHRSGTGAAEAPRHHGRVWQRASRSEPCPAKVRCRTCRCRTTRPIEILTARRSALDLSARAAMLVCGPGGTRSSRCGARNVNDSSERGWSLRTRSRRCTPANRPCRAGSLRQSPGKADGLIEKDRRRRAQLSAVEAGRAAVAPKEQPQAPAAGGAPGDLTALPFRSASSVNPTTDPRFWDAIAERAIVTRI